MLSRACAPRKHGHASRPAVLVVAFEALFICRALAPVASIKARPTKHPASKSVRVIVDMVKPAGFVAAALGCAGIRQGGQGGKHQH